MRSVKSALRAARPTPTAAGGVGRRRPTNGWLVREGEIGRVGRAVRSLGHMRGKIGHTCARFAADAKRLGVDGVLVVDLPPEEAAPLLVHLRSLERSATRTTTG